MNEYAIRDGKQQSSDVNNESREQECSVCAEWQVAAAAAIKLMK